MLDAHDHGTGKGLAIGRLRSGLAANRPAAGTPGNVYFSTDTGLFNVDTGTAWVQFLTEGGQATVTGWTLIDPVIRDTLQFGPEGSATIDATLTRTAAGALTVGASLAVTPAAGGGVRLQSGAGSNGQVAASPGSLELFADTGLVHPRDDGTLDLGVASRRWRTVQTTALSVTSVNASTEAALTLAGPDAVFRGLKVQTDGGLGRWLAGELGGAGAFALHRYSDAGAYVNAPLSVSRSTGTLTLTPDAGQTALTASGGIRTTGAAGVLETYDQALAGRAFGLFANNNSFVIARNEGARLSIGPTGTLTLTPDAGQPALAAPFFQLQPGVGSNPRLVGMGGANLELHGTGGYVTPAGDNVNAFGAPSVKWMAVYAVNGSIQTSSADRKQAITPLDPAACAQAVLDTDWVAFEYTPPPLHPGPPGETPNQSTARVSAHARMVQETAFARHQRGFVLGSPQHRVSDLFGLSDRKSASPSSDLAVVAAALQDALRRLAALEGKNGSAAAA